MNTDELKILIPGNRIEFDNFDAVVYPIGFNQMREFSETLITALRIAFDKIDLAELDLENEEDMKKVGVNLISLLSPIAAKDLLVIFKNCIVIRTKHGKVVPDGIDQIPHWNVAPLITEWLKSSFSGEEKLRPWIEAMKEVSEQIKKMDFNSLLG